MIDGIGPMTGSKRFFGPASFFITFVKEGSYQVDHYAGTFTDANSGSIGFFMTPVDKFVVFQIGEIGQRLQQLVEIILAFTVIIGMIVFALCRICIIIIKDCPQNMSCTLCRNLDHLIGTAANAVAYSTSAKQHLYGWQNL